MIMNKHPLPQSPEYNQRAAAIRQIRGRKALIPVVCYSPTGLLEIPASARDVGTMAGTNGVLYIRYAEVKVLAFRPDLDDYNLVVNVDQVGWYPRPGILKKSVVDLRDNPITGNSDLAGLIRYGAVDNGLIEWP